MNHLDPTLFRCVFRLVLPRRVLAVFEYTPERGPYWCVTDRHDTRCAHGDADSYGAALIQAFRHLHCRSVREEELLDGTL